MKLICSFQHNNITHDSNMTKLVFFVLLAVISSGHCHSTEKVLDKIKSRHVRKYLAENRELIDKQFDDFEHECPGAGDKLKSAVVSSQECIEHISEALTICEAIQGYTLNCTAPVRKVISDCLPEKSKSLPTLAAKSFLAVSDFLCHQPGEAIFELVNPCFWEDPEKHPTEKLIECEEKTKHLAQKLDKLHTVPTEAEICSFFTEIDECIRIRATTYCKNRKTRNAFIGAYEAMLQPCNKN